LNNNPVVIVNYDPQRPTFYRKEKELVRRILGHRISAIEHIGSTAVPILGGKNIIDIMAGVSNIDEANECLSPLKSIGYADVTPQPDNAEWYYCIGKGHHSAGYHLHLVKSNSEHWKRHIVFRNFSAHRFLIRETKTTARRTTTTTTTMTTAISGSKPPPAFCTTTWKVEVPSARALRGIRRIPPGAT
jgi:GrpB-like predicted nucleotidyltransferase (UPF0157 family)